MDLTSMNSIFLEKKHNLELKKSTESPYLNSFLMICLSCVISLFFPSICEHSHMRPNEILQARLIVRVFFLQPNLHQSLCIL